MTTKHDDKTGSPVERHDPRTLLPMLIGGLVLIMIGMIAVALFV